MLIESSSTLAGQNPESTIVFVGNEQGKSVAYENQAEQLEIDNVIQMNQGGK